jgi:hypothetical protein
VGQCPLVFCARSGYAPWDDFAPLGDKISECSGIFVAYNQIGIGTETADFSAMKNSFFSECIAFFVGLGRYSHFMTPFHLYR